MFGGWLPGRNGHEKLRHHSNSTKTGQHRESGSVFSREIRFRTYAHRLGGSKSSSHFTFIAALLGFPLRGLSSSAAWDFFSAAFDFFFFFFLLLDVSFSASSTKHNYSPTTPCVYDRASCESNKKCLMALLMRYRVGCARQGLTWQTDRQFYLTSEKIRYQGEKNDRKVFESSSPSKHSRTAQKKHKSNCPEDDQQSTNFIQIYIYLQKRCRHIFKR